MDDPKQFEGFMNRISKTPLPTNQLARAKMQARELAEGVDAGFWDSQLKTPSTFIHVYKDQRGQLEYDLLRAYGYYVHNSALQIWHLSPLALNLINEAPPISIFISYKRSESSAFALLVLHRLKAAGLEAFLDIKLETGEPWHPELEERVRSTDNFVILLGEKTLESRWVCKEIEWAVTEKKRILPIWQPGFSTNDSSQWQFELDEAHQSIERIQGIKVLEESPSGYHKAIVDLLNEFGITP